MFSDFITAFPTITLAGRIVAPASIFTSQPIITPSLQGIFTPFARCFSIILFLAISLSCASCEQSFAPRTESEEAALNAETVLSVRLII